MHGLSRNCPTDHNFDITSGHICSSHQCQNNGTCQVDGPKEYVCSCLRGISGVHCESKKLHICILVYCCLKFLKHFTDLMLDLLMSSFAKKFRRHQHAEAMTRDHKFSIQLLIVIPTF